MKSSDKEILSQIKEAVLAVDANAELILFGSRARGDYKEDSDWDVLMLSDSKIDLTFKNEVTRRLFSVQLENGATITPVIVNRDNWNTKFKGYPLFREVRKDGIVI